MNACTYVAEEASKAKQYFIGSHWLQRSCENSIFEAMALKPKLQLRHEGAGEVRNRTHHQGNLQEPNEANLKKKACVLQKAKP